ncbi:hypothetical protein EDC04DRAFT_2613257, partial [Pisolithus marmoratus]
SYAVGIYGRKLNRTLNSMHGVPSIFWKNVARLDSSAALVLLAHNRTLARTLERQGIRIKVVRGAIPPAWDGSVTPCGALPTYSGEINLLWEAWNHTISGFADKPSEAWDGVVGMPQGQKTGADIQWAIDWDVPQSLNLHGSVRFLAAWGSSGHHLLISAFMLASKVICDDTYSNKS